MRSPVDTLTGADSHGDTGQRTPAQNPVGPAAQVR